MNQYSVGAAAADFITLKYILLVVTCKYLSNVMSVILFMLVSLSNEPIPIYKTGWQKWHLARYTCINNPKDSLLEAQTQSQLKSWRGPWHTRDGYWFLPFPSFSYSLASLVCQYCCYIGSLSASIPIPLKEVNNFKCNSLLHANCHTSRMHYIAL